MKSVILVLWSLIVLASCATTGGPDRQQASVDHVLQGLTEEERDNVLNRRISTGMTKQLVRRSWGAPRRINQRLGVWVYKSRGTPPTYLYFSEAGTLTGWVKQGKDGPNENSDPYPRRNAFVEKHAGELSRDRQQKILIGQLVVGMSRGEARACWGRPSRNNQTTGASGVAEQWVYVRNAGRVLYYVHFRNGVVTSWSSYGK